MRFLRALAAALLVLAAGCALPAAASAALPGERARAEDFDFLWRTIDREYAYFGVARTAWQRARAKWRPLALRARSRDEFVAALEGAVAQLRDEHVVLSERREGSPRRVPSESDIWASWRDELPVVEAIRTYGEADVAGLRPGHVIRSIGAGAPQRVVREVLGEGDAGPPARDWALRRALAGPRSGTLRIEASEARGPRALEITRASPAHASGPPILGRRIGEGRDLGYVRIKAALSSADLAGQFEGALHHLAGTRALILDLRDVTGPFEDPAAARATTLAILGHFVPRAAAWQAREPRAGERVVDIVQPRGLAYRAPVVVLVDRWTAGEGEALAAGLHAAAGARLVGTRMAGLRGELREVRLAHSGIALRFPAQRTFLPDGTPREAVRPGTFIDLAAPLGGPGDPILYQALKLLAQ